MKTKMKKIISALLAFVLVCAMMSFLAYASEKSYELSIPSNSGIVEVKINGVVKHIGGESCNINVPSGADVTVTATAKTGEFMFWTDENNNTCSDNAIYSFKMIGPKELRAWFGAASGTTILYRNDNTTEQVLGSATCTKPEYFNAHFASSANKLGYSFTGWSLSIDQIKQKIAAGEKQVVITPVYTKSSSAAKINVVGGFILDQNATSAEISVMGKITLKANDAPAGKKFVGWKISGGTYVSESSILDVVVSGDETFTAEFADVSASAEAVPGVSLAITQEDGGILRLWSSHFVPKDHTVVSYGFIYLKNGNVAEQYMTLELAQERGLSIAEYTRSDKSGMLTCTAAVNSICARAFMVYLDEEGNMHTIYSSAITK